MNPVDEHALTCVGCGNCENVCPVSAVKLQEDEEGFLYPVIQKDICILCGRCRKTCPMYQEQEIIHVALRSYAAISKDKEILKHSASGGMFATIAKNFLKNKPNSVVVGATYENGRCFHKMITEESQIIELQNSKYVQSQLDGIFVEIEKKIKNDIPVLFSGSPCQVNALKLFLKRDYESLFTIDIICHGVPSNKFLKRDLELYTKQPETIKNLKFRLKNQFRPTHSEFVLTFESSSNKQYVISNRDPYFSLFMSGDSYRESCYICKFARINRVGDITLGDCDSHRYYPDFYPKHSVSSVIVNTNKGSELFSGCENNINFCDLNLEKEAEINTQLLNPTCRKPLRKSIYKDLNNTDVYSSFAKKYARKKRDWKEKLLLLKCKYL